MTDNELYNYFKDRKLSFNEAPGDELWSKIEEGIPNKKPAKPLILIVLLATITGAAYLFLIFNGEPTTVIEQQTDPVEEATNPIVLDEAAPYVIPQSTDTVKKKKAAKKVNQDKRDKNVEYENIILPATVVTNNEFADEKQEQAIKDSLPGNNKITSSPGKIRIQSLDQLTKEKYDTLVARSVRYYSDQPKSILIIVAEGYKPYRKLIGTALREQDIQAFAPVSGYVKFRSFEGDTIKENIPVLKPFVEPDIKKDVKPAKVKEVFKVKSKEEPTQDTLTSEF